MRVAVDAEAPRVRPAVRDRRQVLPHDGLERTGGRETVVDDGDLDAARDEGRRDPREVVLRQRAPVAAVDEDEERPRPRRTVAARRGRTCDRIGAVREAGAQSVTTRVRRRPAGASARGCPWRRRRAGRCRTGRCRRRAGTTAVAVAAWRSVGGENVELNRHPRARASERSPMATRHFAGAARPATIRPLGEVAQLGERRVRNAEVGSSILLFSTNAEGAVAV